MAQYRYIFSVIIILLVSLMLSAQESKKSDRDINKLNIKPEDSVGRIVLPHKIITATVNTTREIKDSLKKTQQLISEVITLLDKGDLAPALIKIYDAINYCPRNEARTYAIANSYYAIIQIRTGNHSKAVNTLNMCDSITHYLRDRNLMAFHYNNLGLFTQKFYTQERADKFFQQSLAISRSIGDDLSIARSLSNLSKGNGDYQMKTEYIKEAVEINKRLGRELPLAENYNTYANIFINTGKVANAMEYLDMAREIAQRLNLWEVLYNNYELRSRIYSLRGQYMQAYQAALKLQEIQKKIAEQINIGEMEQMITNRLLRQKQYEMDLQKKEYDIRILNVSLLVSISLLVITILTSFYIWFYINNRRKMQKLESWQQMAEKEIEYANSELLNLSSYLSSRNEILNNIQTSLSKTQKMQEKDVYPELRKINLYIRNLQTRNEDVESVMRKITKINEDFIARLSEKHPDITKNDKNIALLLRANLSTKQIATLLDCSPKSINMARYRMRIHLNINNDINLVSYLKSL